MTTVYLRISTIIVGSCSSAEWFQHFLLSKGLRLWITLWVACGDVTYLYCYRNYNNIFLSTFIKILPFHASSSRRHIKWQVPRNQVVTIIGVTWFGARILESDLKRSRWGEHQRSSGQSGQNRPVMTTTTTTHQASPFRGTQSAIRRKNVPFTRKANYMRLMW